MLTFAALSAAFLMLIGDTLRLLRIGLWSDGDLSLMKLFTWAL